MGETGKCDYLQWDPREVMACWPVLLSCQSMQATAEACRWLCGQLGRSVELDGVDLSSEDKGRLEWSLVRHHVIARPVLAEARWSDGPGVSALRDRLFGGIRTGRPVTWGEYNLVLFPYNDSRSAEPRIGHANLSRYLERREDDAVNIATAIPPADLGSLAHSPGRPCRASNREELSEVFRTFAVTPISSDGDGLLLSYWSALDRVANQ